jgi:hypothetical protein
VAFARFHFGVHGFSFVIITASLSRAVLTRNWRRPHLRVLIAWAVRANYPKRSRAAQRRLAGMFLDFYPFRPGWVHKDMEGNHVKARAILGEVPDGRLWAKAE